jgi:hypothetical protein
MTVKAEVQIIENQIVLEGYEPQILVNNGGVAVEAGPRASAVRGAIPNR